MAIIGSTEWQNAGASGRRVALAKTLGVTHVVANYAANDHGADRSLAQLQAMATAIAEASAAEGIATLWATTTPRASRPSRNGPASVAGGIVTIAVGQPEAANYAVAMLLELGGAAYAGVNGTNRLIAVDAAAGMIAFAAPLATGGSEPSVSVGADWAFAYPSLQPPYTLRIIKEAPNPSGRGSMPDCARIRALSPTMWKSPTR